MMASRDMPARSRYNQNFKSSIFEPLPTPQGQAFVPAGKRRDQTTSEMFGTYDEKDLRSMPKTFVPKEDHMSARQKKMSFLASEVLPSTAYAQQQQALQQRPQQDQAAQQQRPPPQGPWMEDDEAVDTNLRRQMELQSKLFGRPTPAVDAERLHDATCRLTPNDFKWHSHPEPVVHGQEMTHEHRAYQEKCSQMFDRRSPDTLRNHLESQRQMRAQDREDDMKRRQDAYYSDLFGRSAHEASERPTSGRRAKHQGSAEDKLIVHQDWTDAKTELLSRGSPRPEHPLLRKGDELYQARIFGPRAEAWTASTERPAAVTHDNSQKLREALGKTPQEIHQAHLRSSAISDTFYSEAENSRHWEVVELHISGLGSTADDDYVRGLCQGFDLQIVKVAAEVDPVRNLCKGRAKVMVRYNPNRESIHGLVSKLEASQLRVEL